jgi:hypothetical protein
MELKPCKCGGKAHILRRGVCTLYVECGECHARTKGFPVRHRTPPIFSAEFDEKRRWAIEAWNRRVGEEVWQWLSISREKRC